MHSTLCTCGGASLPTAATKGRAIPLVSSQKVRKRGRRLTSAQQHLRPFSLFGYQTGGLAKQQSLPWSLPLMSRAELGVWPFPCHLPSRVGRSTASKPILETSILLRIYRSLLSDLWLGTSRFLALRY